MVSRRILQFFSAPCFALLLCTAAQAQKVLHNDDVAIGGFYQFTSDASGTASATRRANRWGERRRFATASIRCSAMKLRTTTRASRSSTRGSRLGISTTCISSMATTTCMGRGRWGSSHLRWGGSCHGLLAHAERRADGRRTRAAGSELRRGH